MITNPFFTITTVTLNNLDGLKKTYASIAAQTCTHFEWLVQDGGSTDGSVEYLKDKNAALISEPDKGIYDAMNRLIDRATGEYILFLNAGDALATPETLQNIESILHQHPHAGGDLPCPAFIYGDAFEEIDDTLNLKKSKPHTAIKTGMFTHHQAMLYNRNAIGDLRYNLAYSIAADYDFTARFLINLHRHCEPHAIAGAKQSIRQKENRLLCRQMPPRNDIIYCPFPFCIFESGGISQTNATKGRNEQLQIRKNLKLCHPITNAAITVFQLLNWQFRCLAPRLYWFLKSR